MRIPIKNNQQGFTIVETVVSVLIFSIISIIVGGIFIQSIDLQRRGFAAQKAQENALFSLEAMAREIRVSKIQNQEAPNCTATTLTLVHPVNGTITYSRSGNGVIRRTVSGIATDLSSGEVIFTRLNFCISGSLVGDNNQPRVTVLTTVQATQGPQQVSFDLQTTLSSRDLEDEL